MKPDYCTQNNGDCETCSLVNYRRDCRNNPLDSETKQARLAALAVADAAGTLEQEQAAQAACFVVDILPSLPAGAADLHHRWNERDEPIHTMEYVAVCKSLGAGFDRGARRYVIKAVDGRKAYDALRAEGFLSALHLSLAK